jgi:predicted nucleic acid-binding protein
MPFVLDASVSLAWVLPDEISGYADAAIQLLREDEALVPPIWPLEVANGLLMAVRRGRMTEAEATRCADLAVGLPLTVTAAEVETTLRDVRGLAATHQLSVYDASYLDLAMRERIPLCTQDSDLRSAAQRAGVQCLDFS